MILTRRMGEEIELTSKPDGGTRVSLVNLQGFGITLDVSEDIYACIIEAMMRGFVTTDRA